MEDIDQEHEDTASQDSHDSGDESPSEQRGYIATSCVFCRKRHLKCGGLNGDGKPCIQCNLRNQECVYSTTKKRGRKPHADGKDLPNAPPAKRAKTSPSPLSRSSSSLASSTKSAGAASADPMQLAQNEGFTAPPDLANVTRDQLLRYIEQQNAVITHLQRQQQALLQAQPAANMREDEMEDSSSDHDVTEPNRPLIGATLASEPLASGQTLMQAVVLRTGFLFPIGKSPAEMTLSLEFFSLFKDKNTFADLLKAGDVQSLTEALTYSVGLALGAQVMQKWQLTQDLLRVSKRLVKQLLRRNLVTASNPLWLVRVISCLLFMTVINFSIGNTAQARSLILQAYDVMTLYQPSVLPLLQHCVYAFMASLATRASDRLLWMQQAQLTDGTNLSPTLQAQFAVMLAGNVHSNPDILGELDQLPSKPGTTEFDYRSKLYSFCVDLIEGVDNHPGFANGKNVILAATLKMLASGARALCCVGLLKAEEALTWANTTIQNVKFIDLTTMPLLVTLSLAYATQATIVLQQPDLFNAGLQRLRGLSPVLPLAVKLHQKLSVQARTAGIAVLDLPSDLIVEPPPNSALLPATHLSPGPVTQVSVAQPFLPHGVPEGFQALVAWPPQIFPMDAAHLIPNLFPVPH